MLDWVHELEVLRLYQIWYMGWRSMWLPTGFGTWAGGLGGGTWFSTSSGGCGCWLLLCTLCSLLPFLCLRGCCWGAGVAAFAGLCTVGSFGAGGPLSAIVALVQHLQHLHNMFRKVPFPPCQVVKLVLLWEYLSLSCLIYSRNLSPYSLIMTFLSYRHIGSLSPEYLLIFLWISLFL